MADLMSERLEVDDDFEAVQALYLERGWTDGLPIVPPTPERVSRRFSREAPAITSQPSPASPRRWTSARSFQDTAHPRPVRSSPVILATSASLWSRYGARHRQDGRSRKRWRGCRWQRNTCHPRTRPAAPCGRLLPGFTGSTCSRPSSTRMASDRGSGGGKSVLPGLSPQHSQFELAVRDLCANFLHR